MTEEREPNGRAGDKLSVTEFTGLVTLIAGMLDSMETRLVERMGEASRYTAERMADNSRLASERWARHDAESARILADWDARFGRLEAKVDEHHHQAELEHVTWDARINPLRNSVALIAANWKNLLLAFFGLLGLLAIAADIVARYLGLPT